MHLFKIRLKCLLRNKPTIFWTLLFPLLLSTLFYFAFNNMANLDSFETINIGIVESEAEGFDDFVEFISHVEYKEGSKMFKVILNNQDDAIVQLKENKISGYIEYSHINQENNIILTIKNSGINETILKTFLDDYVQASASIKSIMTKSGGTVDIETLLEQISNQNNYIVEKGSGNNSPNLILIYFYSLLAMALIYGGIWGTNEIVNLQANLSSKGMRISVGPTKRLKLLLINMSCAFIIHFAEILIFLFYFSVVLGISFGSNTPLIILLCILGSFTGISFGAFIGISLKKASQEFKITLTSMIGVFGGFLSGMMYANIKYWISTNIPILSYINPVNVMTDGLYSLYYFPTLERYFLNIIILVIMCIVFVAGTYINFRRDNYESL